MIVLIITGIKKVTSFYESIYLFSVCVCKCHSAYVEIKGQPSEVGFSLHTRWVLRTTLRSSAGAFAHWAISPAHKQFFLKETAQNSNVKISTSVMGINDQW